MSDDNEIKTDDNSQSTPINGPAFEIKIQYLKDFSFESPEAPLVFATEKLNPALNIKIDVTVQQLQKQDFEVCVHLNADAKINDKQAYLIEMVYGAVVRVNSVPEEMLQPLMFVEIPRLLFPYVRQILTNSIIDGGFPQVVLAPFDFMQLFQERIKIAEEEAAKTTKT